MFFRLVLPVYTRVYPIKGYEISGNPVRLARPFVGMFYMPVPSNRHDFYTHKFPDPIQGHRGFIVYREDIECMK